MPRAPKTHEQLVKESMHEKAKAHEKEVRRRRYETRMHAELQKHRTSARYYRFRRMHLAVHPLCCDPFNHHADDGVVVEAAHIHHIVKVIDDFTGMYDNENIVSVCPKCHSALEQMPASKQRSIISGKRDGLNDGGER